MSKMRLEIFSDGVLAIVITIMVLELKVPHDTGLAALLPLAPKFLSYVLSFIYLGTYWNNHHQLLGVVGKVNSTVLWANLHLLFWLSLVPVATAWMGESRLAPAPTALYGAVLFLAGLAYVLLLHVIAVREGPGSKVSSAIARDRRGWISLLCYGIGVPLATLAPAPAAALYVLGTLWWLVPDRGLEAAGNLATEGSPPP